MIDIGELRFEDPKYIGVLTAYANTIWHNRFHDQSLKEDMIQAGIIRVFESREALKSFNGGAGKVVGKCLEFGMISYLRQWTNFNEHYRKAPTKVSLSKPVGSSENNITLGDTLAIPAEQLNHLLFQEYLQAKAKTEKSRAEQKRKKSIGHLVVRNRRASMRVARAALRANPLAEFRSYKEAGLTRSSALGNLPNLTDVMVGHVHHFSKANPYREAEVTRASATGNLPDPKDPRYPW